MIVLGLQASSRQREYPHRAALIALLEARGIAHVEIGCKEWYGRLFPNVREMRVEDIPSFVDTAEIVVAVDSGILAIALALGKPCIALFGPTHEGIIAKQFERYHAGTLLTVLRSTKPDSCQRPCNFQEVRGWDKGPDGNGRSKCVRIPVATCMKEIAPEEIVAAIEEMLAMMMSEAAEVIFHAETPLS